MKNLQFQKTSLNPGIPLQISFPADANPDYDFVPRPLDTEPPEGPITKEDFYDRFYHNDNASPPNPTGKNPFTRCNACPCYTWTQHQSSQLGSMPSTTTTESQSLSVLPKRKLPLQLHDGKREVFWGLYIRERRCFAWVVAYGCLCNLPGVLFFFLWLFAWGHQADLQNAAVPVQLSLSLTVCFAALLYEGRDGERGR
jgi:hypothetical protein